MLDRVNQYGTDTMSRGAANYSGLTIPRNYAQSHDSYIAETEEADGEDHPATGGNPLTFMFLLLGLIVALWFVRKSSPFLATQAFGVNWLTFLEVTVMATFGILLEKAVFGRWHVRGVTNAVAAI